MVSECYSITPHPIGTIISWIKSGEVAIPEIQRPFVWDATKVRNLLDSLYQGYPIGYLISWKNPNVKLKDGTSSVGKRILIDGQQRVTALIAALLGQQVITKDYDRVRIRIAFNPREERFEVSNPAIAKDAHWIPDIAAIFAPESSLIDIVMGYHAKNSDTDRNLISKVLEKLLKITNNHVGVIELHQDLSIETVTEIFIRVNSMGKELSQADFAMSKIATSEKYGGDTLRKAIDYFSHLAVAPEFYDKLKELDTAFSQTDFFTKIAWLRHDKDDIYDPSYTDLLRVAFTSEFKRGKLGDLVALLSGRNFETKQYEEQVALDSFDKLKNGIYNFINEANFKKFVMIIRSAGFIDSSLIGSQNALNFAYIVYLFLREQKKNQAEIESAVRRWFVMSALTGRYSASPESQMDFDIRQIHQLGFDSYAESVWATELSENYWDALLPQEMITSSSISPYYKVFKAAQVKFNDKGFLSKEITVQDLILNKSDEHHIFPRNYLKKAGLTKGQYNQIANFALTQSEINIAIGDKPPKDYMKKALDQCDGKKKVLGGISDREELAKNLQAHCIPGNIEEMAIENYDSFLEVRRKLMAGKIKHYFRKL